jgi:hypothetical protein
MWYAPDTARSPPQQRDSSNKKERPTREGRRSTSAERRRNSVDAATTPRGSHSARGFLTETQLQVLKRVSVTTSQVPKRAASFSFGTGKRGSLGKNEFAAITKLEEASPPNLQGPSPPSGKPSPDKEPAPLPLGDDPLAEDAAAKAYSAKQLRERLAISLNKRDSSSSGTNLSLSETTPPTANLQDSTVSISPSSRKPLNLTVDIPSSDAAQKEASPMAKASSPLTPGLQKSPAAPQSLSVASPGVLQRSHSSPITLSPSHQQGLSPSSARSGPVPQALSFTPSPVSAQQRDHSMLEWMERP